MKITNIHQAKTHLSQLIEAVLQGEEVVIAKAGEPLVRLIPYTPSIPTRTPGFWQGQVKMSPDFDQTPEDVISVFNDDTQL
ncbi:type II toxin-antitoxin system Phd/YefM family antitoxin [Gloeothece verrucosa]|uniref:Antitoxin n=1 Tax=Gloeothece verrucosa (strain PCC 7822) TaxID=497965 RepID=E0UM44_GLOV7|nr:type II toxin-antitoxin system prevent-host-death family antitoxin [Gloeothece verrucosa]ADN18024.1 prevent-host-death family protein [Gloeothece verrucosa PCC 7822]